MEGGVGRCGEDAGRKERSWRDAGRGRLWDAMQMTRLPLDTHPGISSATPIPTTTAHSRFQLASLRSGLQAPLSECWLNWPRPQSLSPSACGSPWDPLPSNCA